MRIVALAAASILVLGAVFARASGGGSYKGRQVAAPMSYRGAPWLVRDTREAEEQTSELFRVLALRSGMTACDIGVGNGYHALPMAEMVGGTSLIGGYRTADIAALVIITVEISMGLFLMESLRITRLFPVIGALPDKVRVRMAVIRKLQGLVDRIDRREDSPFL